MSSKTYAITLDGVEYRVTAREIADISTVVTGITPSTAEYTGSAITVTPVSEQALVENTDYTITYSDNVSVGSCIVTITGIGNYSGVVTYTLQITGIDISTIVSGIFPSTAVYTGSPVIVAPISEQPLTEGVDYSISYSSNISVGTCTCTITGLGLYSGSVEYDLEITPLNIASIITGITPSTAEYTGSAITVTPISEMILTPETDYTITYSDNISIGTCTCTITGIGNFSESVDYTLEITAIDISTVVTGIDPSTAEYTGSAITVTPISEVEITEGTDYTIDYSDNISVGTCLVTISGIGNYSESVEHILEIVPPEESNDSEDSEEELVSEDTESDDSTDENSENNIVEPENEAIEEE